MFESLQMTSQTVSRAEIYIKVSKYDLRSAVLLLEKKRIIIIVKIQTLLIHFDILVAIKMN